jgi:hypothetical protein
MARATVAGPQEVHELGTSEVGFIRCPGQRQKNHQNHNCDQHRIGQRVVAGVLINPEGTLIGEQGDGQAEERGGGKVHPDLVDILRHDGSPVVDVRWQSFMTSAVTMSVARVLMTSESINGSHSLATRFR